MDRDTVRLILVALAILVIAGIYFWGRFKKPTSGHPPREFGADEANDQDPYHGDEDFFVESFTVLHPTNESRKEPRFSGFEIDESASLEDAFPDDEHLLSEPTEGTPKDPAEGAPFLIQVSVVAGSGRAFHGPDLRQALIDADLLHGEMGIFHRYNQDLTQTLFSVASLVEPGTFPVDAMDDFECPGIVLFFQTARVSDPLGIYDDLVNTSRELAQQLHGIQWDETRQPLSASKIAHMRNLLKQPVAH